MAVANVNNPLSNKVPERFKDLAEAMEMVEIRLNFL